jgi:hypothetical protein
MHSIDWRRPRAHWRAHAQRDQKEILQKIASARSGGFGYLHYRDIVFLAPAEGTAPRCGSVRQARAACSAISRSRKHDDISTLKMTGPRIEQILSKIAAVDVAIYLISKAKSAVSDLPQKKRGRTRTKKARRRVLKISENFENEDSFANVPASNRFVAHVILNRDHYRNN